MLREGDFSDSLETWMFNTHDKINGVLAAVAIGEEYFENWKRFASENWITYATRFNLGIVVFRSDICNIESESWRPAPWQKLLVPYAVRETLGRDVLVLVIDPDFLISPIAPNVFQYVEPKMISVVSQVSNLPYPLQEVKKRIAFLRNLYYDSRYPLDSSLFSSIENLYEWSGLAPQADYFCGGFLLLETKEFAQMMVGWFNTIPQKSRVEQSKDLSWGEEIFLNYTVQSRGLANWLEYKFQAIWIYEMAWKYPSLYSDSSDSEFAKKCIESSLWSCYFLHFAGSWNDSELWKKCHPFANQGDLTTLYEFERYLLAPVTGKPVGRILPKDTP